jgi:ATP-binding cassette, subfamily F, member 3
MDLALTPLQYMAQCFPDAKEPVHRSHLASFGVPADLASQTMFTLSGGQKSRVALAKITWNKPHLLLLDEPSNHLDIDAVDALIAGLAGFEGGVLMVSHDQYLIEASVDELWAVEGGKVHVFHGDFEQYKQLLRKASK